MLETQSIFCKAVKAESWTGSAEPNVVAIDRSHSADHIPYGGHVEEPTKVFVLS